MANPAANVTRIDEGELEGFIGAHQGLRHVWSLMHIVAQTDCSVSVQGETGTGKELVARAIHSLSARKHGPYIKLNCAAMPAGLLESELFGHERGAFTGAVLQYSGRFERAHTGTLFLDEIGDMPLELQPKLLRVLQEHEFERLGGTRTSRVDVRVIAATNHDLLQLVRERRFRADLYYRLHVFPITVPPLRDRPQDIPILVEYFARKFSARLNKVFSRIEENEMATLVRHHWPGNVRELENFVHRAVILSAAKGSSLPLSFPLDDLLPCAESKAPAAIRTLAEAERAHIIEALRLVGGVIGGPHGAASRLGVARTTLLYRMRKLGIGNRVDPGIFRRTASAGCDGEYSSA
jgi:formate hydrogenlyase transcriptional activator